MNLFESKEQLYDELGTPLPKKLSYYGNPFTFHGLHKSSDRDSAYNSLLDIRAVVDCYIKFLEAKFPELIKENK